MRGCGSRKEDGLYACVPSSPYGEPVEFFLQDPAIPFKIPAGHNIRAPLFHSDKNGTYHIIIGVGATYYPFVSDFVEEVRAMGLSKKLPPHFDYRKLDPKKSTMLLLHPRAIPDFSYEINAEAYYNCPRLKSGNYENDATNSAFKEDLVEIKHPVSGEMVKMVKHQCLGDNWALSSALHVDEKHELEETNDGDVRVTTPSTTYEVMKVYTMANMEEQITWVGKGDYDYGIFLQFPKFHFEYVRSKPKEIGDSYTADGEKITINTQDEADAYNKNYETQLDKVQEVYVEKGFGFKVMEE